MRFAPLLAAILTISACDRQPPEPRPPVVENAWIRLPAVAGRPGVAYFTIRGGSEATRLEAVVSPQIERIELHDSRMEDGVSRMAPLEDREIPAGAEMKFQPGGRHAMLFGMAPQIRAGGMVPLHFRFGGGKEVKAVADVVAAGGSAPGHGGH